MTSVICASHHELFASDCSAAQMAFAQLDQLLMQVRRRRVDAPILAIHHARLEIAMILIQQSQRYGLPMLRKVLHDLALQSPAIPLDALHYFLGRVIDDLGRCGLWATALQQEIEQLMSSLVLLHELPDHLLCRALMSISETKTQTLIC